MVGMEVVVEAEIGVAEEDLGDEEAVEVVVDSEDEVEEVVASEAAGE
jgi:hypothetical protein